MVDLVQAQKDLTAVLLSSEQLMSVNVKSYRVMRLQSELDYAQLLTAPRNGRAGAGVLVLQPVAATKNASVSGPVLDWVFPVLVMELEQLNMTLGIGTNIEAERLGQIVMDVLHMEADDGLGTFQVTGRPMEAETEFVFPGVIAYRINFALSAGKAVQTPRVSALQISVGSGLATITTSTADARIKYTLDGTSAPSEDIAGNPLSTLYSAPFAVNSGDVIRAAGYKTGMNKSATRRYVVA